MPDIIDIPPLSPVRSPVRTRLRTSTLAASVRSRHQHNLRTRRHALKDELKRNFVPFWLFFYLWLVNSY